MINWNPGIRAFAHLAGAFAIPAGGAFVSSLAMDGIEKIANLRIDAYNQKHPEDVKDPFKIDPKVRNAIKLISSAVVGITYTYGTLGTEIAQFQNSRIFQIEQYAADIGGSLAGIAAFHKMEFKDTVASLANGFWNAGKAVSKPINALEDKIKGKNKSTPEKPTTLSVENITIDSEFGKGKESRINPNLQTIKTPVPNFDTASKTIFEHSSNESTLENENEIDL